MNVKSIKEIVAKIPSSMDEADVVIDLVPNGESDAIRHFEVLEAYDDQSNPVVSLLESAAQLGNGAIFPVQLRLGIPLEFEQYCEKNHTSPKEVLHGFIADLLQLQNYQANPRLDKLSRNGSDESILAKEYFRRLGYQYRGD